MIFAVLLFICNLSLYVDIAASDTYTVDDSLGLGRRFDGIGGLSGGGVGAWHQHTDLYAISVELLFIDFLYLLTFLYHAFLSFVVSVLILFVIFVC